MVGHLLRRLPAAALTLLVASVGIFALVRLAPGDVASALAGEDADPAAVAALRTSLGLDRPPVEQYLTWAGGVLRGDLGTSLQLRRPVTEVVGGAALATAELAAAAAVLALVGGLALGYLGATARRRRVRTAVAAVLTAGVAVPAYVTGTILVAVLALWLGVLPYGSRGDWSDGAGEALRSLVLPAVTLALPAAAVLGRYTADGLRAGLDQDYVRTARAAGVGHRRVALVHALRPALPGLVTVWSLQVGNLLGGAVVVESVFDWPGLGDRSVDAVAARDYPVVQAVLLLAVATFVAVQLLGDLLAAAADPRIRLR